MNASRALVDALERRVPNVDAQQVGNLNAPPKGTPDTELLKFCEREGTLFITADRATMPDFVSEHLARGGHTWGVFVVGPDHSLSLIVDELLLVYEASECSEWIDVLTYLPFSR